MNLTLQDLRDKGSQEQLSSSQDLESSMEDCTSLKAIKIRGSLSGSEMEGNASSSDDLLSSKDSLNSIPSTPTQVREIDSDAHLLQRRSVGHYTAVKPRCKCAGTTADTCCF